jgi:hypothetical protein
VGSGVGARAGAGAGGRGGGRSCVNRTEGGCAQMLSQYSVALSGHTLAPPVPQCLAADIPGLQASPSRLGLKAPACLPLADLERLREDAWRIGFRAAEGPVRTPDASRRRGPAARQPRSRWPTPPRTRRPSAPSGPQTTQFLTRVPDRGPHLASRTQDPGSRTRDQGPTIQDPGPTTPLAGPPPQTLQPI